MDNQSGDVSADNGARVEKGSSANYVPSANMEQTLCTYIAQTLLPPDSGIELKPDDDLLSIDYLDSMQFMRLVQFTEETFALKIPPEDLLIENFQSINRLAHYLTEQKKR